MPKAHPPRLVCDDASIQSFEGGTISASDGLGHLTWNCRMKFLGIFRLWYQFCICLYVVLKTVNIYNSMYMYISRNWLFSSKWLGSPAKRWGQFRFSTEHLQQPQILTKRAIYFLTFKSDCWKSSLRSSERSIKSGPHSLPVLLFWKAPLTFMYVICKMYPHDRELVHTCFCVSTCAQFHAHSILTLILPKNSSGGKPSHSSIQHSRADSFIPRRAGMVFQNDIYLKCTSPASTVSQNQQHRSNWSRPFYAFNAWCTQSALHTYALLSNPTKHSKDNDSWHTYFSEE